jgi:16S rRNA C967 or C1407 C5-methylase (RsmB/RsmF family)/NOL1/NOP2/fmu family ribosome biogenesis protein
VFIFKGKKILQMQLPSDFVNYIKGVRPDDAQLFFESLDELPITSVRLHPVKGTKVAFSDFEQIAWCDNGLYLAERPYFTYDPFIHAGAYYVQEASSMFLEQMVKSFLNTIAQPFVLDLCAAPGGKSTHLLSLMQGKGVLISNEIVPNRNAILRENITKWGYSNVVVTQNEAADFARSNLLFDLIVVDAPCSGEGMFRKDRNALAEWSLMNVRNCVLRQKSILDEIVQSLKPGGMLVYSTCTFEADENINQIARLIRSGEFEPCNLGSDFTAHGVEKIETKDAVGYVFYPHKVKGEGFFISAIKKKGQMLDLEDFSKKMKIKIPVAVNSFFDSEDLPIINFKDEYHLVSEAYIAFMNRTRNSLRIKKEGINICVQKGKDFVPAPELAFSFNLSKSISKIELTADEAIRFLKCENIHFLGLERGWYLAAYKELGLGWLKVMDNRSNNYFPPSWRILK